MVKITFNFKDFLKQDRTETCYFDLSEAEVTQHMIGRNGVERYFERIVEAQDGESLGKEFADLIELTYGVMSDDGREFTKSKELFQKFKSTRMYNQLYMRLVQDAEWAAKWWNGVIPVENNEERDVVDLSLDNGQKVIPITN